MPINVCCKNKRILIPPYTAHGGMEKRNEWAANCFIDLYYNCEPDLVLG